MVVALKKPEPHKGPGRPKRKQERPEELLNMEPTLRARCAKLGWEPTEANLRTARREDFGMEYALTLFPVSDEDQYRERFATCELVNRAYNANWRRLGKDPHPKTASLQYMQEEQWADPEATPKVELTEEEQEKRSRWTRERQGIVDKAVKDALGPDFVEFLKCVTLNQPAPLHFVEMVDKVAKKIQDVLD